MLSKWGRQLAAIGSGVHIDAAAHGSRNPSGELQADISPVEGENYERGQAPRPGRRFAFPFLHLAKAPPKWITAPRMPASVTRTLEPFPKRTKGSCSPENRRRTKNKLFDALGLHKKIGRAASFEGGIFPHGSVKARGNMLFIKRLKNFLHAAAPLLLLFMFYCTRRRAFIQHAQTGDFVTFLFEIFVTGESSVQRGVHLFF